MKYEVPAGDPGTFCKACGYHIWFVKTASGKMMPINWDGEPHWATCSSAAEFRKYPKRKMDEEE